MPASICAAWVMALTCKGSHAVRVTYRAPLAKHLAFRPGPKFGRL